MQEALPKKEWIDSFFFLERFHDLLVETLNCQLVKLNVPFQVIWVKCWASLFWLIGLKAVILFSALMPGQLEIRGKALLFFNAFTH